MAVLTREQILARKVGSENGLNVEEVPLGDGSGSVVVRGLTRAEGHRVGKLEADGNTFEMEALALHLALVDPAMSLDDVRDWLTADASGFIQPVVSAVQRLSGNAPGAGKEATKSVP